MSIMPSSSFLHARKVATWFTEKLGVVYAPMGNREDDRFVGWFVGWLVRWLVD